MRRTYVSRLNPITAAGLLLLLALLGLTACSGASAEPADVTLPGQSPTIKILTPNAGENLPADAIEVHVDISGFIVDAEAIGKEKVPGRGHWHVYVDGEFVSANAVDHVALDQLSSGPHHLRVSLANNDHSPLSPPVETSVVFDVREGVAAAVDRDPN